MDVGNKDKELPPSTYINRVIQPGDKVQINACGRSDSASGTTGELDVVDPVVGDKVIRHLYWDCPWGSKDNQWIISQSNSKWQVYSSGANYYGGALGNITVDVVNKPGM